MKGILKVYHPEETLTYNIENTYCKAVYANEAHTLEVEIITDDSLDHVEDDSLQYNFPQITLNIFDFPLKSDELENMSFDINDSDDEIFTETLLDGYDDETFIYDNHLQFSKNEEGILELIWEGQMDDVFSKGDEKVTFKLKCHFKEDGIEIDED